MDSQEDIPFWPTGTDMEDRAFHRHVGKLIWSHDPHLFASLPPSRTFVTFGPRKKLLLKLIKAAEARHLNLINLRDGDRYSLNALLETILTKSRSLESVRHYLTIFDFLETCKARGFTRGNPLGGWDDPHIVELLDFLQSTVPQERHLFQKIYADLPSDQLKAIYLLYLENFIRLTEVARFTWEALKFSQQSLGRHRISDTCLQVLLRFGPDGLPLFNDRPSETLFFPMSHVEISKALSGALEEITGREIPLMELQHNWRILTNAPLRAPLFEERTSIFDFLAFRIYHGFREPMTGRWNIVPAPLEVQLEELEPDLRRVQYVEEMGFRRYESDLRNVLHVSFYSVPWEMRNASMRQVIVGWCLREGIPMPKGYWQRWQGERKSIR